MWGAQGWESRAVQGSESIWSLLKRTVACWAGSEGPGAQPLIHLHNAHDHICIAKAMCDPLGPETENIYRLGPTEDTDLMGPPTAPAALVPSVLVPPQLPDLSVAGPSDSATLLFSALTP